MINKSCRLHSYLFFSFPLPSFFSRDSDPVALSPRLISLRGNSSLETGKTSFAAALLSAKVSPKRITVAPELEADTSGVAGAAAATGEGIFGIWKRMSDDYFGHGPSAWYWAPEDQVRRDHLHVVIASYCFTFQANSSIYILLTFDQLKSEILDPETSPPRAQYKSILDIEELEDCKVMEDNASEDVPRVMEIKSEFGVALKELSKKGAAAKRPPITRRYSLRKGPKTGRNRKDTNSVKKVHPCPEESEAPFFPSSLKESNHLKSPTRVKLQQVHCANGLDAEGEGEGFAATAAAGSSSKDAFGSPPRLSSQLPADGWEINPLKSRLVEVGLKGPDPTGPDPNLECEAGTVGVSRCKWLASGSVQKKKIDYEWQQGNPKAGSPSQGRRAADVTSPMSSRRYGRRILLLTRCR